MAVPFMPDQREGYGELFCLRLIDGNGQTDQITLVGLVVVMAVSAAQWLCSCDPAGPP